MNVHIMFLAVQSGSHIICSKTESKVCAYILYTTIYIERRKVEEPIETHSSNGLLKSQDGESFIRLNMFLFLSPFPLCLGEAGQPPKISEHPADSVVPRNEPATLNCKAEGDPSPQISWTKDGKHLQFSDSRQLRVYLPSGSLFFLRVSWKLRDITYYIPYI